MPRIIVQMIVRNEASRYLREVLENACSWSDLVVILDDRSSDNTVAVCRSFGNKVMVYENQFQTPMFSVNESQLRDHLWNLVRKHAQSGDWIVSLDADEVFDDKFRFWIRGFVNSTPPCDCITVRFLDMWSRDQYRVDGYWSTIITRVFKFRDAPYGKHGTIHCGCVPSYVHTECNHMDLSMHMRHLGWVSDDDKKRKSEFYLKRARGIDLEHARSIFAPAQLRKWQDPVELPNLLVGSLVRDRAWVLDRFLAGLGRQALSYPPEKLSFLFIVNDSKDSSEAILQRWAENNKNRYRSIEIRKMDFGNTESKEHVWCDQRLLNMAKMRDTHLQKLQSSDNEYLISIDSDIVLNHDDVFKHLVSLDRQIVSEVFWATWGNAKANPLPNVWVSGGYDLNQQFLAMLKKPGLYEVGGLGAITCIHRSVPEKGVTYQRDATLPKDVRGEDRDFCSRARKAGLKLWADTCRTPTHVERAR